MLADLNAGHIGRDGLELALDIRRSIGFHVKRILMRGTSPEKHQDNGLFIIDLVRGHSVLCRKQSGQRQPHEAGRTDLDEFAPGNAVAVMHVFVAKIYHMFCLP